MVDNFDRLVTDLRTGNSLDGAQALHDELMGHRLQGRDNVTHRIAEANQLAGLGAPDSIKILRNGIVAIHENVTGKNFSSDFNIEQVPLNPNPLPYRPLPNPRPPYRPMPLPHRPHR